MQHSKMAQRKMQNARDYVLMKHEVFLLPGIDVDIGEIRSTEYTNHR